MGWRDYFCGLYGELSGYSVAGQHPTDNNYYMFCVVIIVGCSCPVAIQCFGVHVRAGMCIAVLFGREEDEEGANTVPAAVTSDIVRCVRESCATL